jgi:4-nitrophenyl phosphatase
MVAHVTDVALEAGLHPVIVVLGCRAEETYPALGDRPILRLINRRWDEGLSTSVQTGLSAVPPEVEGAIFLQCDQPGVTPSLLQTIVDRFRMSDRAIVHPIRDGERRTPVLFPRRFFSELAAVAGDEGGRSLLQRHANDVMTVTVDNLAVLTDVDTPADYQQLKTANGTSGSRSAASILRPIRSLLIDMDGVLWRGDEPQPGLEPFFAFLRRHDITFMLATNNATLTPGQYTAKLADFGVTVSPESILTSSLVVAAYLADVAPSGARVYAIGETGLEQALEEQGFTLDDELADFVVVGWDRNLSFEKLTKASLLIHRGASFVGTNPDVSYPTEQGPAPGNGAILAALEAATGVSPVVTGKPEPRMYEEALRRLGASADSTAMIGDRIDTDMAGAARVGLTTVLTLSGIATADDVASSWIKPDLVCEDLASLLDLWEPALP